MHMKKEVTKRGNKHILIGLSWPYANGRLHIGNIGSSLPADAIARYHRMVGNSVAFVSGSDCYGTPILVAAKAAGVSPKDLSDKFHKRHSDDFLSLGFTFDNYTKTTSEFHNSFVQKFHAEMYRDEFIFERSAKQLYCEPCNRYLPDRYVEGTCPHCKGESKGDSCDHCGKMIEAEELLDPKCKLCNAVPVPRDTRQLYLAMSRLQETVQTYFDKRKPTWANNAVGMTGRYLKEGLRDRAISRNIEWGVELPSLAKTTFGFSDKELDEKRIYIWAENVLGYFSACAEYCEKNGLDASAFLVDGGKDSSERIHYYVHAKDNIPFHSLILPSLLLANKERSYHLPDIIVSSEYIKISDSKISKSKGNLITCEELVGMYCPDMVRYYFLRNINDKKDVNFSHEDFKAVINAELVNSFSNLVNRTLSFVKSKFDGKVKVEKSTKACKVVENTYTDVGRLLAEGKVNRALARAMDLVSHANKLFDEKAPWVSIKTNPEQCMRDITSVLSIIANLCRILHPFIPYATTRLGEWLRVPLAGDTSALWKSFSLNKDFTIGDIEILYSRI